MPQAAKRPCSWPGCGELTDGRFCADHARADDRRRGTAAQRGYGHRWQKARAAYLKAHPLCRECEAQGLVVPATVVDHIVPHRGDRKLFWDRSNWQPLCKEHHDRKTATEDGGFGRGG